MDNIDLLIVSCASQNAKRGPIAKKDKAVLKWLGIIWGIALVGFLLMAAFAYSLL